MSYDVDIRIGGGPACEHCGRGDSEGQEVFESNYTSNIAFAMYEAAYAFYERKGEPLPEDVSWFYGIIQGKRARDVEPLLRFTVQYMRDNMERLSLRNPGNKWGSVESCANWLERVANACAEYPDGIMSGSA